MHFRPTRNERIRNWCEDAVRAIDAIISFIDGFNIETYRADLKTTSAVERQLFIIAEVIARMPEFASAYEPAYKIRGLANRLRHEYEAVDDEIIWDAISGQPLRDLRAALVDFSRGTP